MGLGTAGFAQVYGRSRPDILLVLGDRFEMYAAALAALSFKIPLGHIHGGELTQGAIDDALRHSMTKLSHLHFVSVQEYGRRVAQLGEEKWRIIVSGALSLDLLRSVELLSADELRAKYGIRTEPPPLLVTFHPVTLEHEQTEWQTGELLAALDATRLPIVFTLPNADTNGRVIARLIEEFVSTHTSAWIVPNLGPQGYASLMTLATAMVGNSSSGMLEAAPLGLPVVNVGTRQQGRLRTANIVDVGYRRKDVLQGIKRAVSSGFRDAAAKVVSPFGDGRAAGRIVSVLKQIPLDQRLLTKHFVDYSIPFDDESPSPGSMEPILTRTAVPN